MAKEKSKVGNGRVSNGFELFKRVVKSLCENKRLSISDIRRKTGENIDIPNIDNMLSFLIKLRLVKETKMGAIYYYRATPTLMITDVAKELEQSIKSMESETRRMELGLKDKIDICEICGREILENPYELNNKVVCQNCFSDKIDNDYEQVKDSQMNADKIIHSPELTEALKNGTIH